MRSRTINRSRCTHSIAQKTRREYYRFNRLVRDRDAFHPPHDFFLSSDCVSICLCFVCVCVGGAFKTMPVSPKDGKPVLSCDSVPMEPDAAKMQIKTESSSSSSHQTPPTIFTFNTLPTSSECPISRQVNYVTISNLISPHQPPSAAKTNGMRSTRTTVCVQTKVSSSHHFLSNIS